MTVGGVAEDTIKNIENVNGGCGEADRRQLANVLTAAAPTRSAGGNGDDTLKGGLGADTLNGGGGVDIADYPRQDDRRRRDAERRPASSR